MPTGGSPLPLLPPLPPLEPGEPGGLALMERLNAPEMVALETSTERFLKDADETDDKQRWVLEQIDSLDPAKLSVDDRETCLYTLKMMVLEQTCRANLRATTVVARRRRTVYGSPGGATFVFTDADEAEFQAVAGGCVEAMLASLSVEPDSAVSEQAVLICGELYALDRFPGLIDGDATSPVLARRFDEICAAMLAQIKVIRSSVKMAEGAIALVHKAMWYQQFGPARTRLYCKAGYEVLCQILFTTTLPTRIRLDALSNVVAHAPTDLLGFLRSRPDSLDTLFAIVSDFLDSDAIEPGRPMTAPASERCGSKILMPAVGLTDLVNVMLLPSLVWSSAKHDADDPDAEFVRLAARPHGLTSRLLAACERLLEFTASRDSEERSLAAIGVVHALSFAVLLCAFDDDAAILTAEMVGCGAVEIFCGAFTATIFAWHPPVLCAARQLRDALSITVDRLVRLAQLDDSIKSRLEPLFMPIYARLTSTAHGGYHPTAAYTYTSARPWENPKCVCETKFCYDSYDKLLELVVRIGHDLGIGMQIEHGAVYHWPPKVPCCRPGCNKPAPGASACSQCAFVRYCCKECQRAAWPQHRVQCQLLRRWPLPPRTSPGTHRDTPQPPPEMRATQLIQFMFADGPPAERHPGRRNLANAPRF